MSGGRQKVRTRPPATCVSAQRTLLQNSLGHRPRLDFAQTRSYEKTQNTNLVSNFKITPRARWVAGRRQAQGLSTDEPQALAASHFEITSCRRRAVPPQASENDPECDAEGLALVSCQSLRARCLWESFACTGEGL